MASANCIGKDPLIAVSKGHATMWISDEVLKEVQEDRDLGFLFPVTCLHQLLVKKINKVYACTVVEQG